MEDYKRKLELAKERYNSTTSKEEKEFIETLFPELKESEDEKIRKDIIAFIERNKRPIAPVPPDDTLDRWIAYLAFQAKQKLCMIQWKGDNLKEVIGFTGKNKNFDKWFTSFEEYERYVHEHNNIFKLFNEDGSHYEVPVGAWIVKTPDGYNIASKAVLKQKPTDKVEPKFKVGDWITNGNGEYTWKVTSIYPLDYILQSPNGNTVDDTISHIDEHFHLWTIQDAKDGDVLTTDTWTFIFKKYQDKSVYYHCAASTFNDFSISDTGEFDSNYVHPATKEQRELLFQKMKEEGYEWNADNKELRKIEQIEQNPTWGGEDEKTRKAILELVKQSSHILNPMNQKSMISWLEKQGDKVDVLDDFPTEFERQISHLIASSINKEWEYKKDFVKHTANALLQYAKNELEKQGKQKPSWNEEDREMLDNCLGLIQEIDCTQEEQNWLKSLKDRFQLQPKQEWSEEDEKRINSIISSIKYCSEQYPDKKEYARDIDWIKSFKSNHWKPSEEQMNCLETLIDCGFYIPSTMSRAPIESLYNDLKKL